MRVRLLVLLIPFLCLSCTTTPTSSISEHPARPTLQSWGFETLNIIDRDYRLPGQSLYRDTPADTHPAQIWPAGIQLSALNAAAKLDPPTWLGPTLSFVAALDRYWIIDSNLAGYDPRPNSRIANRFYDDNAWIAIALYDTYELSHDTAYLQKAQQTLNFVLTGEDEKLGGGIYWRETGKTSKNTCSNAPTIVACLRMYQLTHTPEYLTVATRLYAWVNTHLQDTDGLYFDSLSLTGQLGKTKWSYNTALMLRANCLFYESTNGAAYLEEARRLATASLQHWFRPTDGALMDESNFAHLLTEALLTFDALQSNQSKIRDPKSKIEGIRPTVLRSLDYVHTHTQGPAGHYPKRWDTLTTQPITDPKLIHQSSAARAYLFAAGH